MKSETIERMWDYSENKCFASAELAGNQLDVWYWQSGHTVTQLTNDQREVLILSDLDQDYIGDLVCYHHHDRDPQFGDTTEELKKTIEEETRRALAEGWEAIEAKREAFQMALATGGHVTEELVGKVIIERGVAS